MNGVVMIKCIRCGSNLTYNAQPESYEIVDICSECFEE